MDGGQESARAFARGLLFPDDFLWGAATASYQIEGSPLADGAGPSIWHRFAHTPGTVAGGDTGDVACDHYRRFAEDVDLLRRLGLGAYRFSVAWPRVIPDGRGPAHTAGLDFYERLVDALLAVEVEPFVTLYHWDLPSALQDLGGWTNRDCAGWFADYADAVFERLGDRVRNWITLNEPWVVAFVGHVLGWHPPGTRDLGAGLRAVHHLLLGHGRAVARCRSRGAGRIGITNVHSSISPATSSAEDAEAADRTHALLNEIFLEPIVHGAYPSALLDRWADVWPEIEADDMEQIRAPVDFLGVNYYFGSPIAHAPGAGLVDARTVERGLPRTEMGWEIDPEGFYDVLRWIDARYRVPIYVTENGAAFDDCVDEAGGVTDDARIDYLRRHLAQAHRAVADGVDLRGYFVWSLLDNFEWTHGYSKRFGIVRVDYETQKRTIKDSGRWYAAVARENAMASDE